MSLFFSFTKIINPEIIFIDATITINAKIKNITFFSTFRAFINDVFLSIQDKDINLFMIFNRINQFEFLNELI